MTGQEQIRELVPDAGERHGARDLARLEPPRAEQAVRAGHPDQPAAGRNVRQRSRGLRERQRLPEPQAG